jgi:hypothetical protein
MKYRKKLRNHGAAMSLLLIKTQKREMWNSPKYSVERPLERHGPGRSAPMLRRVADEPTEQQELVEFMRSQRELPGPGDTLKNFSASPLLFRSRAKNWNQAKTHLISLTA